MNKEKVRGEKGEEVQKGRKEEKGGSDAAAAAVHHSNSGSMGTLKLPKHSWLSIEKHFAKTLRLYNWIYSIHKTNHAQQLVMLLRDAVDDYSLLEVMLAAATGATLHNASRLL